MSDRASTSERPVDLWRQLESLFDVVWACERQWAIDDRFNAAIKLISFQPDSPLHGLEGLKHMASAIVPGIYDPALADEDLRVATETAYNLVRRLAREEGLLVGVSSGAALAAVLDVARRIERGVIVTVFPDGAEKYLTEAFWTIDD